MRNLTLICAAGIISLGLAFVVGAGQIDPPAGPVNSTGRFGTRVDILSLSGDGSSTHVISQSGSYYLSGNLSATPGTRGIQVIAADVTIDLNGFTIDGNGGHGIQTGPGAGGHLVIKNGTIVDGDNGIFVASLDFLTVEDVSARDCAGVGIFSNPSENGGIIRGCSAHGNGTAGMALVGVPFAVSDCVAMNNGGEGINSSGSSLFSNCISLNNGTDDLRVVDGMIRGCVGTNLNLGAGSTGIDNHTP